MIRMFEQGVPTDILDLKIHHISFGDSGEDSAHGTSAFDGGRHPLSFHGPWIAMMTILQAPEVEAFEKAHNIEPNPAMYRLPGNALGQGLPDVRGELNDVTLSQALDYVLSVVPGYWVYEDASCEDGTRQVRFAFY